MQEQFWKTSVEELITIFQGALNNLIPQLKKARIPIGIRPGVDAWDEITEALYRHIVEEAIRNALPESEMEDFRLPVYEMDYDNYWEMSYIEVIPKEGEITQGQNLVFHSFYVDDGDPPDLLMIACCVIDQAGKLMKQNRVMHQFPKVSFRCCYRKGNELQFLETLSVAL